LGAILGKELGGNVLQFRKGEGVIEAWRRLADQAKRGDA